jgi:hypothetical protein
MLLHFGCACLQEKVEKYKKKVYNSIESSHVGDD